MEKKTLRRADLVFSIILIVVSVLTMIESIKLFFNPFGRDFEKVSPEDVKACITNWYESPALLPFILAAILLFLAVCLMHVALKDGAKLDFFTKEKIHAFFHNRETGVAAIVIGILCIYIFVLIPQCRSYLDFFPTFQGFPFMVATFISLAAQMIVFNEKKIKKIVQSLVIAALAAAAVTYGFGTLAMIPLP